MKKGITKVLILSFTSLVILSTVIFVRANNITLANIANLFEGNSKEEKVEEATVSIAKVEKPEIQVLDSEESESEELEVKESEELKVQIAEVTESKEDSPKTDESEVKVPEVVEQEKDSPKANEPEVKVPEVVKPKEEPTKPEEPETKVPEVVEPKEDSPKTDESEVKVPEVVEPKEDSPKANEPEVKVPEVVEPKEDAPKPEEPEAKVSEVVTEPEKEAPKPEEPEAKVTEVVEKKEDSPKAEEPETKVPEVVEQEKDAPKTDEPETKVPEVVEPQKETQKSEEPKENQKPEVSEVPENKEQPKVEEKEPEVEEKEPEEVDTPKVCEHTFGPWEITVEPICYLRRGERTRKCTACGLEEKESYMDVEAHIYEKLEDIEPTCERTGQLNHRICKICGAEVGFTPALGHIWSEEYTVDREATCEVDGVMSHHCMREGCTSTTGEVLIPATGHTIITENVKATCTESGKTVIKCAHCDYVQSVEKTTEALGHKYTEYVSDGNATCCADGTKTAICEVCGHKDVVTEPGTQLEHKFVTLDNEILPTCETEGREAGKQCEVCGKIEEGKTIAALGHQFVFLSTVSKCAGKNVDVKCTRCYFEFHTDGITFGEGHQWNKDFTGCTCENCSEDETWWRAWRNGHKANVIWFVGFTCNTNQCEGFIEHYSGNRTNTVLEGRRGDVYNITMKAPTAKNGYRFAGWYDVLTGKKVEEKANWNVKNQDETTGAKGDTILVNWRDMCKGYEARYELIED